MPTFIFKLQVGIDLIGPLPWTEPDNRYIVTLVDYFSKWPEAAPLPDKTAMGSHHLFMSCSAGMYSDIHTYIHTHNNIMVPNNYYANLCFT